MKQEYSKPQATIIEVDTCTIIATSPGEDIPNGEKTTMGGTKKYYDSGSYRTTLWND